MARRVKNAGRVTAEAARRITGISTPLGGVQWADPGPSEAEIVRDFLVFLEDRRVLYNPMDLEEVSQVEHSIHEIRKQCTQVLQSLTSNAFAVVGMRAIRAAGRRFHDDRLEEFRFFDRDQYRRDGTPGFFVALGAYRATVGYHVAALAAHYDLDVEGDLASILPHSDEGEQP